MTRARQTPNPKSAFACQHLLADMTPTLALHKPQSPQDCEQDWQNSMLGLHLHPSARNALEGKMLPSHLELCYIGLLKRFGQHELHAYEHVSICTHIYIYAYVYTYIYYMYTYRCININMRMYIYIYLHVHIQTYIYRDICISIHKHAYT